MVELKHIGHLQNLILGYFILSFVKIPPRKEGLVKLDSPTVYFWTFGPGYVRIDGTSGVVVSLYVQT